ncbi:MAG TPA: leucyl aminopeptidase [Candidatus Magasanikbacteria bacterium]|nr:MAG: hypothetical protein A3I74_03070 [Candidatus Magasanikbacteria bacterium RIFCSPLOWO2_02_FULL_47_16]OGH79531.1 MAG: hypothetical protein A3C10_00335 [Candidatus Magasanikbacteria bacterium RIFCSPHIGHO2_02_FULL_48_18]OGH83025.1 MAG: hypothetical protein A3G08_04610 [Candidatus Magasanikbacteria bacterium RIFCSPLOWO2_12_FULL_47_9b]HAZ28999.1 leucyl aminopeptidase [Candidatus Magasanikbacteria bacterium]
MASYHITSAPEKSEVFILPFFEKKASVGVPGLSKDAQAMIAEVVALNDFAGKKMHMQLVYTKEKKFPRICLLGLGDKKDFSLISWKKAVGASVRAMQEKTYTHLSFFLPEDVIKTLTPYTALKETVIASEIAAYAFDEYKEKKSQVKKVKVVSFVAALETKNKRDFSRGIEDGAIVGEAINYARHLGNIPPTIMTPALLGKEAERLATISSKIKTKVLARVDIRQLGMGCLLGVSSGSQHEPKFIILDYQGGKKDEKPVVLVGKGVTFDSGGLSLKPGEHLSDMKFDMLGAATVLGVLRGLAALGAKRRVVGLIPSCENMPGGEAYRPDDILRAMNGATVEIVNTDAEGRLILADALSYAGMKYTPKEVIDIATLTGACMVALGIERSGLFSPEDTFASRLLSVADEAGEQLWRLPLGEEFRESIKSDVADVKNLGGVGRPYYGGASVGAAFLQVFTEDLETGKPHYPWAHIDLSCAYYAGKGKPWIRGGANGFGIETLIEYIRR